jgi:hypothetical protein
MIHFTNGYELTTALTNILIFIVSIYSYLNTKDKKWKLFFLLLTIDSFLGVIVHGIVMSITLHNILWVILTILFVLSTNTLLTIFVDIKSKIAVLLSIALSIILLIEFYLGIKFLLTFTMYTLIVSIITFIFMIKNNNYKNKIYFILAYISQVIGGIFLLSNIELWLLNHNGFYHIFMALTILFFYIGIKKQLK